MHDRSLGQRTVGSELRALLVIARKEWTIFRRYPSWVVAFLIWPILFPFGYIFSARALAGPDGGAIRSFEQLSGTSDYISFIVIGTTIYMWVNVTLWDVGFHLRNEQMRGTLESNWLCPVWRISILLGSSLTKMLTATMFIAITLLEFWLLFDVRLLRGNTALLLLIVPPLVASIYGLGIAFGSLVLRFKEANALVFLVRGIVAIFCGITFPLAVLPGWMQAVAAWLPFTYAMQATRAVTIGGASLAAIWPDLLRLLGFAIVLPLVGYLSFRYTERRARRTGSLGQY